MSQMMMIRSSRRRRRTNSWRVATPEYILECRIVQSSRVDASPWLHYTTNIEARVEVLPTQSAYSLQIIIFIIISDFSLSLFLSRLQHSGQLHWHGLAVEKVDGGGCLQVKSETTAAIGNK